MALSKACLSLVCLISLALVMHTSYAQEDDYIKAHNAARAEVHVDAVHWNKSLAAYAQTCANNTSADCKDGRYGKNIARIGCELSGKDAVDMWVAEKADYNYTPNTCAAGKVCTHFTQVVWRDSIHIGCAKAKCINGGTVVVCFYQPKGNIDGQHPY